MSTAGVLCDRVIREYLYAADDLPVFTRLTADMTNAATSATVNVDLLSADDLALLDAGSVIEVGSELMLVLTVNDETGALTVVRAHQGSAAAAHTSGDVVYVSPAFPRINVFNAVADNVVSLWPHLYAVLTTAVTTTSTFTEAPADIVQPVGFRWLSGGVVSEAAVEYFPWTPAASDHAIRVYAPTGSAGYLTYRAKFARPTSEATDLTAAGVQLQWERIIAVGAAAQLLVGRDLETLSREYATENAEAQAYPEGSTTRKREGLVRMWQLWITQARRELHAQYGQVVATTDPFAVWAS